MCRPPDLYRSPRPDSRSDELSPRRKDGPPRKQALPSLFGSGDAHGAGDHAAVEKWQSRSVDWRPEAWVFPSEKMTTPIIKDNCWRRHFAPHLKAAGLSWVNFQVTRRTQSCLLKELDVDPHVRAEQMGHTVDVNENVYTRTSL